MIKIPSEETEAHLVLRRWGQLVPGLGVVAIPAAEENQVHIMKD